MVVVLKLIGFPFDATTRDLKDLFRGLKIREADLHIGRDKGVSVGFAVFSDDDEARRATTRSGQMIGPRRVTVSLSSSAEMDAVLSRRAPTFGPRGSPPGRGRGTFGRPPPTSFRGRGRGRGRGMPTGRPLIDRSDRDFDSRPSRPMARDERSGPVPDFRATRGGRARGSGLDEIGGRPMPRGEPEGFNERKFVKAAALPYTAVELDLQDFFRGILTREIYICRHESGRFAGRPNGDAIIEFFSEQDAREALERDGKRMGPRIVGVSRVRRDEIKDGIRLARQDTRSEERERPVQSSSSHEVAVPKNKEQLQNLLDLLKTAIAQVDEMPEEPPPKPANRREQVDDPVIRRVARNANINMRDIGEGKVVGIRNLPFSVTPDDIISFFRGYGAIADSVRIHYSEDGRSSGDAIITFRTGRDANRAIANLNKRNMGKRKVDLFIM